MNKISLIVFVMNRGIYYWVSLSLYHPPSPCIDKICEEKSIVYYDSFDMT